MEVPRCDFLEVLPTILQKLETASFVSFDAEYTGLKGDDGESASLFDTTSERYEILRKVVLNNSAPQFGLAIFQRMNGPEYSSKQEYTIDAYCFYLTEPCFAGFNMDSTKATLDIDCCEFLNGIRFNYDKWFKESVPYLNENKAKKLEKYLNENPNIREVCKRNLPIDDYKFIFGDKTGASKLTEDEKREIIQRCRGFSVIAEAIAKQGLPVVGHNMALDMMYFFHQFCKDLPEKYEDFKAEVANHLPALYDTKYMTVRSRKNLNHPALNHAKKNIDFLKCSGLYVIYKTSSAVVDRFSPSYSLSSSCEKFRHALEIGKTKELEDEESSSLCHEPSFDACVTGIVFLNLVHIASSICKTLFTGDTAPEFKDVMHFVRHFQNQIFVSRATVMSMCLRGNDPRPNRSWVRVVWKDQENGKIIDVNHIMKELKSDPQLQRQLPGIDHQLIGPNELVLAVSRVQTAHDLCEKFGKMGLEAARVLIPWDKKRYENVDITKSNDVYDSRRNKFFF